jgi:hypothetical protein
VVCPLLLVGTVLQPPDLLALMPVLAGAAIAMALAIGWIGRANISLEAAQ